MKTSFALFVLIGAFAAPAFAWHSVPTCTDGRGSQFTARQAQARAADKKAGKVLRTKESGPYEISPRANVEKFDNFKPWILASVNGKTLLRDQIIALFGQGNLSFYSALTF